jgi:Cu2+-exporting ATPase
MPHLRPIGDTVATGVVEHPGAGIEGVVDGRRWRIGRAGFAAATHADDGSIWLGDGEHRRRALPVRRGCARRRRGHARVIAQARHRQLKLASGDGDVAVTRFAGLVGIDAAHARMSPEGKLAHVRDLQAQGRVVAMVGDGINDGPVLAGADVSFALGDGNALAARAADLVLASPTLLRIPQAIVLARRTRAVIRQNLAWALLYNLLALPAAALGMVSPWQAALGMALSSLLVTANALRLARVPRA